MARERFGANVSVAARRPGRASRVAGPRDARRGADRLDQEDDEGVGRARREVAGGRASVAGDGHDVPGFGEGRCGVGRERARRRAAAAARARVVDRGAAGVGGLERRRRRRRRGKNAEREARRRRRARRPRGRRARAVGDGRIPP